MQTLTPEERAEQVEIVVDEVGDPRDPSRYVNYQATHANIAAAIREAVAAEQERFKDALRNALDEQMIALDEPAKPSRVIELPYGSIPRDCTMMACAGGCGGTMGLSHCTTEEARQFGCGREGCCERAFFCDRCLARAVGRADAPEANHMRKEG